MKNRFRFWVGASLVLVYGVIAAGAIVRMTGSGMGCPDWPKCFGYLIPPQNAVNSTGSPNTPTKKERSLLSTKHYKLPKAISPLPMNGLPATGKTIPNTTMPFSIRYTPGLNFKSTLGALGGLATLVVGLLSFGQWKRNKWIPLFAWLIIVGMGFQAWLGKTVVDSNLLAF